LILAKNFLLQSRQCCNRFVTSWLAQTVCQSQAFYWKHHGRFAMTHSPNRDPFLDQIATALHQRGLNSVALALLEVGQPLTFIGGQLMWLAQPALSLLWPAAQVRHLAQLLEDPTAVRRLMAALATKEAAL
jgi:hypothetical protein